MAAASSCRGRRTISRIVVLPDYQGIGIAGRLLDAVAELITREKYGVTITSGHPAMMKLLERSERWQIIKFKPHGSRSTKERSTGRNLGGSIGRATASAIFLG